MRFLYFICITYCVVLISSCSYKQDQILFQKRAAIDTTQQATPPLTRYRIKPYDLLQIRNLQNIKYIVDELPLNSSSGGAAGAGQIYQVEEDGTVALPVIGHVQVSGLTRVAATRLIEDMYRKNLLQNPIIDLKITNLKVTILGEIASQGNVSLTNDNTTLVELIGQAGGLTPNANEKNIRIIRGDKVKQVTEIDLGDINSITDPRAILQNGDIIYIAKNKRAIRNDKLQNFTTLAQPAILLLNTALLIFSLSR